MKCSSGFSIAVYGVLLLAAAAPSSAAAPVEAQGIEFFEKKIRPVLIQHCYKCHSAETKEPKGGLMVDSRAGIRAGGDTGAAIVPGSVKDSLLIEAIRHEDLQMPPDKRLSDAIVADFVAWVEMGAPDPRNETIEKKVRREIDVEAGRKFWAFQPPRSQTPPAVEDSSWPQTDVDRFILARLEAEKLAPNHNADRRKLIRRATLDLTGLLPAPEEVEQFVGDTSPTAFEKVIDRLLASPRYGETWGRHWLDVARFAESTGKDRNFPYHYAWRYRNYVIDAVNRDTPYDQFIRQQLAGDLMTPPKGETEEDRNQRLMATGFLAIGTKGLMEGNAEVYLMDVVDEQIDVTCRAILGLTVSRARCHDHKFDPIPTNDYYALAGIFRSTNLLAGIKFLGEVGELLPLDADSAEKLAKIEALDEEVVKLRKEQQQLRKSSEGDPTARLAEIKSRMGEINRLRAARSELNLAMAATDCDQPADCKLCIRGEARDQGPEVPRGFVTVAAAPGTKLETAASGRLELANWLAGRDNPLTARVMVNRTWQYLFGRGLVETVDDFGTQGSLPSHPELLDYLAVRFMDEGWSLKRLLRELMLSRVYQLSSEQNPTSYDIDPENRLLWRASRRRQDAEAIRDTMLQVAGRLDFERPTGSPVMKMSITEEIRGGTNNAEFRGLTTQRSVYLPALRGVTPPEILNFFDGADTSLVVGRRESTIVPTQALYMMNSPFIVEQSRQAARVILEKESVDERRVDLAYRLTLTRPATSDERQRALSFVNRFAAGLENDRSGGADRQTAAWSALVQVLLASAEFRYID